MYIYIYKQNNKMKTTTQTQYVSYIRMSKLSVKKNNEKKQLDDSYGIEVQRQDIKRYVSNTDGILLNEFIEIETGTARKKRIEIYKALDVCKQTGATLIVGKLDRLARDVAFTATLMNSGINFICCDNPHATRLTIHILAAVAEDEAIRIKTRIKAGLAIAKSKGVLLGSHKPGSKTFNDEARQASIATRKELALMNSNVKRASGYVCSLRSQGITFQAIADKLNAEGFQTARNKAFTAKAVQLISLKFC